MSANVREYGRKLGSLLSRTGHSAFRELVLNERIGDDALVENREGALLGIADEMCVSQ